LAEVERASVRAMRKKSSSPMAERAASRMDTKASRETTSLLRT
jgi:hypothetical protein